MKIGIKFDLRKQKRDEAILCKEIMLDISKQDHKIKTINIVLFYKY